MSVLGNRHPVTAADLLYAAEDPEFQSKLPGLFEFLTLARWDDGTPRQPGTALFFAQDGLWKAWLNDRDSRRSCFFTCEAFLLLLSEVNTAIVENTLAWRSNPPGKAHR